MNERATSCVQSVLFTVMHLSILNVNLRVYQFEIRPTFSTHVRSIINWIIILLLLEKFLRRSIMSTVCNAQHDHIIHYYCFDCAAQKFNLTTHNRYYGDGATQTQEAFISTHVRSIINCIIISNRGLGRVYLIHLIIGLGG